MTRKLTEEEKIRIIELVDEYGRQWKLIGEIVGKHPNTCQSFYLSYSKYHTINPTLGRPMTIDQNKKNEVMSSINEKPDQTLRKVAFDFKISHSSVKSIFKQNKLKFFKKSPLAPLTAEHKTARCNFTFQFISKS